MAAASRGGVPQKKLCIVCRGGKKQGEYHDHMEE